MYLWKVKALAQDFREGKVTQKEQMKYYLLFSVLTLAAASLSSSGNSFFDNSYLDWVDFCLQILITALGIIWCFQANQQGDDRDFVGRMVCIGLPLGIRISVWIILLSVIYFIVFGIGKDLWRNIFWLGLFTLFNIYYYYQLRKYIAYISSYQTSSYNEKV
ncbi:hypothetical protein [Anaeroselena agilis]|uniref:Uncharacterized protein n=1 Tax=Anaeroselena agilis TaxID=3063788 RepID=A0ABU3NYY5_9FIRM|nr:hypothetical protein [Selenomonadales bacterium 4137-cl]